MAMTSSLMSGQEQIGRRAVAERLVRAPVIVKPEVPATDRATMTDHEYSRLTSNLQFYILKHRAGGSYVVLCRRLHANNARPA
jgi:hypothetical protein